MKPLKPKYKRLVKMAMKNDFDDRYGASKRLDQHMEQQDREMLKFTVQMIAVAVTAVVGVLVLVFW